MNRSEASKQKQRDSIQRRIMLLRPFKEVMLKDVDQAGKDAAIAFLPQRKALNDEVRDAREKARKDRKTAWRPKLEAEKARIALLVDPESALDKIRKKVKEAAKPGLEARAQKEYDALRRSIEESDGTAGEVPPEDDEDEDEDEDEENEDIRAAQ